MGTWYSAEYYDRKIKDVKAVLLTAREELIEQSGHGNLLNGADVFLLCLINEGIELLEKPQH